MLKYTLVIVSLLVNSIISIDMTTGPLFSQRYPDNVMEQRLCLSVVTGIDFIQYSMATIMNAYIRFYNDPIKY